MVPAVFEGIVHQAPSPDGRLSDTRPITSLPLAALTTQWRSNDGAPAVCHIKPIHKNIWRELRLHRCVCAGRVSAAGEDDGLLLSCLILSKHLSSRSPRLPSSLPRCKTNPRSGFFTAPTKFGSRDHRGSSLQLRGCRRVDTPQPRPQPRLDVVPVWAQALAAC